MDLGLSKRDGFARNSLDIVRLAAAFQVMLFHLTGHLHIDILAAGAWGYVAEGLLFMPGLPVLYFISGFVIAGAWNRRPEPGSFAIARLMRVYPGLILCTLFSLGCLFILYDRGILTENAPKLLLWVLTQLTFGSWNPEFLRGYGVGVVNGSLWTIPVEMTFYLAAALLLTFGGRLRRTSQLLLAVIALSLLLNAYVHYGLSRDTAKGMLLYKMGSASIVSSPVWLWMFAAGMLAEHWFAVLRAPLVRAFPVLLIATIVLSLATLHVEVPGLIRVVGNNEGLINFVLLMATILSFAYRYPTVSQKLLRGNDVSYGLYLFHMPVLNAMLMVGLTGVRCLAATMAVTLAIAIASWFLVEKPMLRLGKTWRDRTKSRPSVPAHPEAG